MSLEALGRATTFNPSNRAKLVLRPSKEPSAIARPNAVRKTMAQQPDPATFGLGTLT